MNLILLNWDSTLVEYDLTGYLLFLFRTRALKMVLAAAVLCACYGPVHDALIIHNHAPRMADPRTVEATRQADAEEESEEISDKEDELQLRMHGSFKESVSEAAGDVAENLTSVGFYLRLLGYPLPLLLLGLYVGRRRILQDVSAHVGFYERYFGGA